MDRVYVHQNSKGPGMTAPQQRRRFRLKELSHARGMTLDDLARASGVKFKTVERIWQNRTPNPTYDTMRAIAKALDCAVEELETPEEGPQEGTGGSPLDSGKLRAPSMVGA